MTRETMNLEKRWNNCLEGWLNPIRAKLGNCAVSLREFLYGMTVYELDLEVKRERRDLDNLFMLLVFGDFLGLPPAPPYYSLRLLPHAVPVLDAWKHYVLKEKDLPDKASMDL